MKQSQQQSDHAATPLSPGNMTGFAAEFTDIVDYIKRITYRIWEGKQVGLCYDYYAEDCEIYTLDGVIQGSETVVQNTLETLAMFPDRTLHADQIIWSGDAEEGYHSSHRICTHMTHSGRSAYGTATGKKAIVLGIAHCIVKQNRIVQEWLVRDNYALFEQLGYRPETIAQQNAQLPEWPTFHDWQQAEIARIAAQHCTTRQTYPVQSEAVDNEAFVCALLHNLWNAKMLGDIMQGYAEDARLYTTRKRELNGHSEITQFYVQLLSTFSALQFSLDHVCSNTATQDQEIAVRWSLSGLHTGSALYGDPTHERILIIGESHFQIKHHQFYQEWTIFDELSLLTQIERIRQRS